MLLVMFFMMIYSVFCRAILHQRVEAYLIINNYVTYLFAFNTVPEKYFTSGTTNNQLHFLWYPMHRNNTLFVRQKRNLFHKFLISWFR